MKLKEILKDIEKINKLNLKYNLGNKKRIVLSEKYSRNPLSLDSIKNIKDIQSMYIETLANKLINDEWKHSYDNTYYMIYINDNNTTFEFNITICEY